MTAAHTLPQTSTSHRRQQPAAAPLPAAPVESGWTSRQGNRCVRARCPFCRRLHIHGWPHSQPDVGHRVAHCGAGDYEVTGADSAFPTVGAARQQWAT
jgi:hypothetical protein